MSSDASPRSRRDRPAKPALSRDAIVDAALAIVREEGIDALSMRRVAQALDTGPASLYVYVANRDALWELLFDAALATVATEPTDPERWREQLHELAARIVQMMAVEYPGHGAPGDGAHPGRRQLVARGRIDAVASEGRRRERPGCGLRGRPIGSYTTAIAYEQSLYAALYNDPEHWSARSGASPSASPTCRPSATRRSPRSGTR